MKTIFTLITFLLLNLTVNSQINGYAKVTAINVKVLTVSDVNETYGQFNDGDQVLILQVQDDVIGTNTSHNASFGNLSNIQSAGTYEIAEIKTVSRVAGVVNTITIKHSFNKSYNIGPNSSLQIITFPTLGTNGYTTTANIIALPWNGNIGGVVAFNVNGILDLQHNILADNAGFNGGIADVSTNPYGTCNATSYFNVVDPFFGNKGEGIYKNTNPGFAAGKGKMINGGGGANTINSGGGGGSNFTGGGTANPGWSCTSATGGIGGEALNTQILLNRVFFGGGGGSGEANDFSNNKGGNGGGLILITAQQIRTTGTGVTLKISANGQVGNDVGNDGAGGGGAGGSLVLQTNSWSISPGRLLTITANGGNGGNVVNASQHGGGAGGGQGAAMFTATTPTTNVTVNTLNGIGGLNNTGGTRAPGGLGTNNGGIITSTFIILPVKLISFTGAQAESGVQLKWITENEKSVKYYEIEFSGNGSLFTRAGSVSAKVDNDYQKQYAFTATVAATGTQYYRLRMVDNDGKFTYSNIIAIRNGLNADMAINVYPNPAKANPVLNIKSFQKGNAAINILSMQGAMVASQSANVAPGDNPVVLESVNNLPGAVYNIRVIINKQSYYTRLIVQ